MEEKDERMKAENLIKSLEETYSDLRKSNPDKDEHWFLANTWLKRYGSGEEAKEKGAEWAKLTAYKESYQFSILEPPKSIRGLALILIYEELGEQQAKHYESEFSQIMEQIVKSKGKNGFLNEYKQRNPLTWEEVQVGEVWMPWTEDPSDVLGLHIRETQSRLADKLLTHIEGKLNAADESKRAS